MAEEMDKTPDATEPAAAEGGALDELISMTVTSEGESDMVRAAFERITERFKANPCV